MLSCYPGVCDFKTYIFGIVLQFPKIWHLKKDGYFYLDLMGLQDPCVVLMAVGQKNWCTLCFVLLFFVPLVALATPLYILLVLIIGLSRVVSPSFSWTFFGFDLTTSLNSMLRMLEVTGESSSEQLERQSSHQWPTTLGTPTTAP